MPNTTLILKLQDLEKKLELLSTQGGTLDRFAHALQGITAQIAPLTANVPAPAASSTTSLLPTLTTTAQYQQQSMGQQGPASLLQSLLQSIASNVGSSGQGTSVTGINAAGDIDPLLGIVVTLLTSIDGTLRAMAGNRPTPPLPSAAIPTTLYQGPVSNTSLTSQSSTTQTNLGGNSSTVSAPTTNITNTGTIDDVMRDLLEKIAENIHAQSLPTLTTTAEHEATNAPKPEEKASSLFDRFESLMDQINSPSLAVSRGQQRGGFFGSLQETAGRIGQAVESHSETQSIGNVLGAGAAAASAIPGAGMPVAAALKFGETLFSSIGKIREWSNNLHNANMEFAEMSGAMAKVQAEQEVRDLRLQKEKGDARAESARDLAEAKSRLDRSLAPLENGIANIKNKVVAGLSNATASVVEAFQKGSDHLKKGFGYLETLTNKEKEKKKGNTEEDRKAFEDFLKRQEDIWDKMEKAMGTDEGWQAEQTDELKMAKGWWAENYGKPKRFQ